MLLQDLAAVVTQTPHLGNVSLDECSHFIRLAKLVRGHIEKGQRDNISPPVSLPPSIHEFLGAVLGRSYTEIAWYWHAWRDAVWTNTTIEAGWEDVQAFFEHGLSRSIGYRDLFPPTRVCMRPQCRNYRSTNSTMTLTEPITYPATLFTLREGALPIHTTSLYCHSCHHRYHLNYSVDKASSTRTYYGGPPPPVIQVATHFFVEAAVLELFGNAMTFGWMSANNCARIYNTSLSDFHSGKQNNFYAYGVQSSETLRPRSWSFSLEMTGTIAMNGFLLYSLLLDKAEHHTHLELPHDCPTQNDRLSEALTMRNKAVEGIGQEAWAHACDLCFKVNRVGVGEDVNLVKVQYAVGDGLSIGRPCCAVHDCKNDLETKRDVYCTAHSSHYAQKCAVLDCDARRVSGFQTCSIDAHRMLEQAYHKDGPRAIHQLRARLRASGVSVPQDSVSMDTAAQHHEEDDIPNPVHMSPLGDHAQAGERDADSEVVVSSSGDLADTPSVEAIQPSTSNAGPVTAETCDEKSTEVKTNLKARFGRRRTHNEQIISRPCGVILSRATFYGSEAVSGVKEHYKAVFPTYESTPEIFIYDNNCKLREHIRAAGDTYFDNTGLPVDVFHFKAKHRITDMECQRHCNPAAFPDLVEGDKWRVNTSICEETNAWLGGFMAVVREMDAVRYTFFLDEVIKRRNRFTIRLLERRGHCPWTIPMSVLFPSLCT